MMLRNIAVSACLVALSLASCSNGQQTTVSTDESHSRVAIPMEVRYAKGFSIERKGAVTIVSVKEPWPNAQTAFTYALYPAGTEKPTGIEANAYIQTPISNCVTFSTTYVAALAALGSHNLIVGIDNADYLNDQMVLEGVRASRVLEVAKSGAPDIETLISLSPGAVFSYGMGNEWDTHPKMLEAGLPVIIVGDWNEADPLGRAEWIKFFALFVGKEAEANSFFESVERSYLELKANAARVAERPTVIVDGPFQGTWWVAGGNSYQARLIADAGGDYVFSGLDGTGSVPMSLEEAFGAGQAAWVWLKPAMAANSLADVRALDPRFGELECVRHGRVWNSNLKANAAGFSEYAETGAMRPDLVLADMIRILHPELGVPGEFHYFKKLD